MKKIIIKRFSMVEIVLSFAIFAMLSASFFYVLNKLDSVNAQFEKESIAISVFDNFIERLSAEKNCDFKHAKSLFMNEFDSSPLKKEKHISTAIHYKDAEAEILVVGSNNKTIAGVKIKCEK